MNRRLQQCQTALRERRFSVWNERVLNTQNLVDDRKEAMNFSEIMDMLRNPQAMQARVAELREKTSRIRATGSAGGGLVKVTLSGEMEMISCLIAPEMLDPSDPAMVQDLVRAAHNDAIVKIREALQGELSSGMDGMNLPPGFGMPGSGL